MKAGALTQLLRDLRRRTGPDVEVLADPSDDGFRHHARRWSDLDRRIPAAIVLPETEAQIQVVVRWAVEWAVPFVVKSGGHSNWSTCDGIVIDLSKYSGLEVEVSNRTAKLRGSILTKEVAVGLAETGHFTALGNGNTVGAIPYFLNGGASITNSLTGYGSDQILSARMVDARGRMVEVSREKTPGLFYAIRGAGQFFGLITELTVRIWPLSELGKQGTLWSGRFVYPLDRAREVAQAMELVVNDSKWATAGLVMAICPPPARKPALVVAARFRGDTDQAELAFEPLHELGPLMADGGPVAIQNICDGREALEAKGGYKTFGTVGLKCFDVDRFLGTIDVWKRLMDECPDAINTTFNFQWDSRPPPEPEHDSANCLHDVRFWQNNIIWYTEASSGERVAQLNAECIAVARGFDEADCIDFANATREGALERRFRGEGRLERLRALKIGWDAGGVFTRQFLD
ncbi:hypothetical protein CDD80_1561 [Ophiocordyceps camponoti-rufipedis]|uniref:FAD-binding PCMH-type domain-containing protein n=1 Tax=Ophiocordyceps camponoti-rufipedis TaxID=2004952 RepID=A0A2C5XLS8_9HYPO|nr:hypothetical protein CDD80_1561 [Ophiocordyceps camponoti-rufipedis]